MQLVVAAAGAALGGAIAPGVVAFGLTGGAIGWQAGMLLGGALFAPTQKVQGPRLGDLSVSGSSYGQVLPYVEGHPRIGGQVIWASSKREIATTTRHGKGGGGTKVTTYTYEVDLLIELTDCQLDGILRIFSNGELVFSQSADATYDTLVASIYTSLWNRLTFYGGGPTQLPDPDYEAAVGAGNAPAYRGRGTVFIKSLQLGQSGQIPNLTFEVVRNGDFTDATLYFTAESITGELTGTPGGDYSAAIEETVVKFGSSALARTTYTDALIYPTTPVGQARGMRQRIIGQDFTLALWVYVTSYPSSGNYIELVSIGPWHNLRMWSDGCVYPRPHDDLRAVAGFSIFQGTYLTGNVTRNPTPIPLNTWTHVVLQKEGQQWTTMVNGDYHRHYWSQTAADYASHPQLEPSSVFGTDPKWGDLDPTFADTYDATWEALFPSGRPMALRWGGGTGTVHANSGTRQATTAYIDNTVLYSEAIYSLGLGYSVPTTATITDARAISVFNFDTLTVLASDDPSLQTVVERLCTDLAGLDSSQIDADALGAITTKVHGLTISQVSSVRSVLEILMGCYFFDAVLSDKLYFYPRAGSTARTIPYDDLGWTLEGNSVDPLPLMLGNEIELPAQLALSYSNIDADYQTDTQYSDRLLTSQENMQVVQVPLGLTAAEAKKIVDARLADMLVGLMTTKVSLDLEHADLEPTDVVLITANDGSTFRKRLVKRTDTEGLLQFDAVLDDATVFSQLGLTVGGTDSQTTVVPVPDTLMELLDIPLLRDDDNRPGFYMALKGSSTPWLGASVYYGFDDVNYLFDDSTPTATVFGTCATVLGNWTRGTVFDESSVVQVNIDTDELSSTTREAMLNDETINAAVIGNELVQFRTATLVSTGIYNLTGFLRGRKGTEWASIGHGSSERFVLLDATSMRFALLDTSELGRQQFRKAVTTGQRLSAVAPETITPAGVNLKPYSPVYVAANRDAADTILTWIRRTRLSTRFGGPTPGAAPLGEESERYEVDIYTASNFLTVVRSMSSTEPTVTYTAAQQTADFGSPQSVLHIKVYQVSAIVGRGYAATASV